MYKKGLDVETRCKPQIGGWPCSQPHLSSHLSIIIMTTSGKSIPGGGHSRCRDVAVASTHLCRRKGEEASDWGHMSKEEG